ncbi:MAG TPA: DUF488 domain-containing protein [Candidatus Binatia bacterium]|nr:MAG: hypothetical protein A2X96_00485 [Syntrophobacterales bacterium GWC2_56_13]HJX09604.1 DUF488 domain-containing protein [Candidatus Binatia bacterium]
MLFERQKHLLALVNALGGEVGGLYFQKMLLLYCLEVEVSPSYEFVPYKFGGFSFTSYADKRCLIRKGFLVDEDRTWKSTPAGKVEPITVSILTAMSRFVKRHKELRGDALVAEVYRRHPYYAIRSEIAERLLVGDITSLKAIAAARPSKGSSGLCTIGYEGRTLEGFLNALIQDEVTVLCDVRHNPLSRKYGFSKSTLQKSCEGVGIRYEHLPELGIASENRRGLKTLKDYDNLFDAYIHESLPKQLNVLKKIMSWIEKGERVALTCYERLPEECHRTCMAKELERRFGKVCTPKDL